MSDNTTGVADLIPRGTVLGERFEIEQLVGEGGMGKVYRARDRSTELACAVKVLHKALATSREYVGRFKREAQAASRFRHAAAVKVLGTGQTDDRIPFIAMELVEGKSLKEVLAAEAPLAPGRACNIIHQVLRALGAAHQRGIVHRDVKPDNIRILIDEDGIERPKLLDFGIAKFITGDVGDVSDAVKTKTGVLVGTPKYMSPEQLRGQAVDGRTDIYAAGAMLYEMFTSRPPFEAEDVYGFVMLHLKQQARPISVAFPELKVPDELDEFVLSMLEKEPSDRPSDAEALGGLIEPWVVEDPRAAEKGKARKRGILATVGAGVIAAGIVAVAAPTVRFPGIAAALGLGIGAAIASVKFVRPSVVAYVKRLALVLGCLLVLGGAAWPLSGELGIASIGGHALAALLAYACYLLVWASKATWARFLAAGIAAPAVSMLLLPVVFTRAYNRQGEPVYQVMRTLLAADQQATPPDLQPALDAAVQHNVLAVFVVAILFGIGSLLLPRPGAARL